MCIVYVSDRPPRQKTKNDAHQQLHYNSSGTQRVEASSISTTLTSRQLFSQSAWAWQTSFGRRCKKGRRSRIGTTWRLHSTNSRGVTWMRKRSGTCRSSPKSWKVRNPILFSGHTCQSSLCASYLVLAALSDNMQSFTCRSSYQYGRQCFVAADVSVRSPIKGHSTARNHGELWFVLAEPLILFSKVNEMCLGYFHPMYIDFFW